MTYLGIDWGRKRIGLAVGAIYPKGAGVLDATKSFEEISTQIKKIIAENGVEKIVIGLPTLPSGDEGNLAPLVRSFGDKISAETNLPVFFEPESFTSTEATAELQEKKIKFSKESGKVDELAAVLILEQFLSQKNRDEDI